MKSLFVILLMSILGLINTLSAQVFDYVVAKDGSGDFQNLQDAINACPDGELRLIFIKAGIYEEKVMIGSHSKVSTKVLSLIGEDVDKVVITWNDYNGKSIVYDGKTVTSGTPQSATFTVNAQDFYAENITIKNTYTEKQAVALYNVGDKQTFKNCKIIGYQDTHYTKKGRRSYYANCLIEGATDYICGGGTCLFDNCDLQSIKNGSYITAPEDITTYKVVDGKRYYYGFIFRDCILTSESGVNVFLGRPWQATSSSIFISCKMDNIKPEGWSTWSSNNHESSFFAEYNSLDLNGNLKDISGRVAWSFQLDKNEIDSFYTDADIFSVNTTTVYDPFTRVLAPQKSTGLTITSNVLYWTEMDNIKGYVVYKDGLFDGFTTVANYHLPLTDSEQHFYSVKAIALNGNLGVMSDAIGFVTGIESNTVTEKEIFLKDGILSIPENKSFELFSMHGILLMKCTSKSEINLRGFTKGIYLIQIKTINGIYKDKIYLN